MFWPAKLVWRNTFSSFRGRGVMLLERGDARNFLSIVRGRCVMLLEEGEIIGVNWDASTPLRVPEYQYKGANMAVKFLS